jgi:hypothetical protein
MSKHIHIQGDKNGFVSKGAIDRFKNDLRQASIETIDTIDSSKYFKTGWKYTIESNNETDIKVKIEEEDKNKENKEETKNKDQLLQKLKVMKDKRKSDHSVQHYMKKENKDMIVPHEVSETYARLKKSGNTVISPADVLKTLSEHKKMLEQTIETFKGPSNPFIEYYRQIFKWIKDM